MKNPLNILYDYRKRNEEKKKQELTEKAKELFQLKEYKGLLWFTYNGNLVCPASMLNGKPVAIVGVMRKLYLENSENE